MKTTDTGTVLLVEDDAPVRMVIQRILSNEGFKVIEADGGLSAISSCEDHTGPIDLLLTDVILPQLNGWQVADRVAATWPDVRVLYMSGYDENTVSESGVFASAGTFLEKPFTMSALLEKVRGVLE